jgi:branched-chain amino acid transport system substrate-binding protein
MQPRKLTWALLSLLALTALAVGCQAAKEEAPKPPAEQPAAPERTVKIGLMAAMTGLLQSFGKNSLAAARYAVDQINAQGGVRLRDGSMAKLELVVYDEGCPNVEQGLAAARKAASDPVVIVVGPTCSSIAEPVFGILQKKLDDPSDPGLQLPFFTDVAIKAGLASISPWVHRNVPSEIKMYEALFKWLKETTGYSTIAVGTEVDFAHSKSTSDAAIKPGAQKAGFTIVADEGWKLTDTDFSAQVSKMKAANPDVVALASHPFTTCGFLKEAARQGFRPKLVIFLTSTITEETVRGCGRELEGGIGPTSFAPINKKAREVSLTVADNYNGFIDLHSAGTYENIILLKQVIEKAGIDGRPDTVLQDRRKIRDALSQLTEFDGLLGKIRFRTDQPREVDKPWLVVEFKGGKFQPKWIPPEYQAAILTD